MSSLTSSCYMDYMGYKVNKVMDGGMKACLFWFTLKAYKLAKSQAANINDMSDNVNVH